MDSLDNVLSFFVSAGLSEFCKLELYEPLAIASSYTIHKGRVCIDSACAEHVRRYNELVSFCYRWVWEEENVKPWAMLGKALDLAYDQGEMGEDFFLMTNMEALNHLSKLKSTKEIIERVITGNFYHRAFRAVLSEYPVGRFISRKKRLEIEREISREDDVIVVVGKVKIRKRIAIPFIDLQTSELLKPSLFFENKDMARVYVAVYCENEEDVARYGERAESIFSRS